METVEDCNVVCLGVCPPEFLAGTHYHARYGNASIDQIKTLRKISGSLLAVRNNKQKTDNPIRSESIGVAIIHKKFKTAPILRPEKNKATGNLFLNREQWMRLYITRLIFMSISKSVMKHKHAYLYV